MTKYSGILVCDYGIKVYSKSEFGFRPFEVESGGIRPCLLPFFPPHDGDGDIVPMIP